MLKYKTELGFKKKGSHTKLLFKCTSLSPSVTMKLESSFKVNIKSNMKKKLYICMAEADNQKANELRTVAKKYVEKDLISTIALK